MNIKVFLLILGKTILFVGFLYFLHAIVEKHSIEPITPFLISLVIALVIYFQKNK